MLHMTMRHCVLTILCVVAACQNPGAAPNSRAHDIRSLARPVVEGEVAVGFVVGTLSEGEDWVGGFGETRLGSQEAPGAQTLYEIGSITKVFTGVLLAGAVLRGEVNLEDPVNRFLPPEAQIPDHASGPVRLWHLTTHTSGLPRMPGNFKPANAADPYVDYSEADLFAALPKVKTLSPPGEKYAYSNLGGGLLGVVLARATGQPYGELLRKRILDPLELRDTRMALDDGQRARLAPPYDADRRPASEWHFDVLAPAGALRSSADDLLRFARAVLDPPKSELGDALRKSREELFVSADGKINIAFGWHKFPNESVISHDGRTLGYAASLTLDLEHNEALVFLTNSPGREVGVLAAQALDFMLEKEIRPNPIRVELHLSDKVLDRYVGTYRFGAFQELTLSRREGGLLAQMTFQGAAHIYASGEEEFFYRAVDARIIFDLDKNGRPTGLALHQNGQILRAQREE
jgi:CubicO group peptidase (beta-lactamase class C family)